MTQRNQYNQYLKEVEKHFFFLYSKEAHVSCALGKWYAKLISMLSLTKSICKDFCYSET